MFLVVFLSIYGYMHLYFIKKLKSAFDIKSKFLYLILIMTLSPAFYKYYDKLGYDNYYMSLFILLWMGFIMLFFLYYLFIDIYHFILKISEKILKHNPLPHISSFKGFIFITVLTLSSMAYGYYETLNLKVYKFEIYSDKIKRDVKILHISDLHLNQVMREDKINLVLDIYNKEKPDIVISTGDLVDGYVLTKESYVKLLNQMNPPLGKYAILGNHEYYNHVNQAIEFTEKAGFKVLRDETFSIQDLAFVGVDDEEAERFKIRKSIPEKELFKNVDDSKFVIFLKHQPKLDNGLIGKFDLMLAGHTHGGVLWPVKFILRKIFITDAGFLKINNSYIFVSRGIGTGGPPIRIGCPPDMAIFYLKSSSR